MNITFYQYLCSLEWVWRLYVQECRYRNRWSIFHFQRAIHCQFFFRNSTRNHFPLTLQKHLSEEFTNKLLSSSHRAKDMKNRLTFLRKKTNDRHGSNAASKLEKVLKSEKWVNVIVSSLTWTELRALQRKCTCLPVYLYYSNVSHNLNPEVFAILSSVTSVASSVSGIMSVLSSVCAFTATETINVFQAVKMTYWAFNWKCDSKFIVDFWHAAMLLPRCF